MEIDEGASITFNSSVIVLQSAQLNISLDVTIRTTYGTIKNGDRSFTDEALILKGTLPVVTENLLRTTFYAGDYVNSLRLNTTIYFPGTPGSPVISFDFKLETGENVPRQTMIVSIRSLNNPVQIDSPSLRFVPNPVALEADFGQYWMYEGSPLSVRIPGTVLNEIDQFEGCPRTGSCSRPLDVTVRSLRGVVNLNTRTGISFYAVSRTSSGFLGEVSDVQNAVRVLFYQLETSPDQRVNQYFNTQSRNLEEFILLTISDQGFSGLDPATRQSGLAQTAQLRLNITVVAVNDAPTVKSIRPEFAAVEDTEAEVPGAQVTDVDVDEVITSSYAQRKWMSLPQYQAYLNQLRVRVSVSKGKIRVSSIRNVNMTSTTERLYFRIQDAYNMLVRPCDIIDRIEDDYHDFCYRVLDVDVFAHPAGPRLCELSPRHCRPVRRFGRRLRHGRSRCNRFSCSRIFEPACG
jgi:hypothetical protein